MKKALRFLLVILISFVCLQSYAQTFGIKGGFNLSNLLDKDDDEDYSEDFKMKPGFHVGGVINIDFTEILSMESGLLFTTRGFKWKEELSAGESEEIILSLYYLDIPILLKGSFDVGSDIKVFGVIGPYIGVGLSGKAKFTYDDQGETDTETEDICWGNSEDDDLKRLDAGLTFGAGVEINAIQIGISYDLGLANISIYNDNGHKVNNRVLKFSVAYWFGKN